MTTDDPQHDPEPAEEPTAEEAALGERLTAARPVPAAGYRGALRRRLVALGPPAARPARLWTLAILHALAGLALLAIGALSVAGIGPLAS